MRASIPMQTMITNIAVGCPGGATVTFPSVAGQEYELDWSTNLPCWTPLCSVVATNGSTSMADTNLTVGRSYAINQIMDQLDVTNALAVQGSPDQPAIASASLGDMSCFPFPSGGSGGAGTNIGSWPTNMPVLPTP